MPSIDILFGEVVGGYPQAFNGERHAIQSNDQQFFIDIGKNSAFETMVVSEPNEFPFNNNSTITSLAIILVNAIGTSTSTLTAEIWNETDGAYTTPFIIVPPYDEPELMEVIPPSFPLWNKSWTPDDISGTKIRLANPSEPDGGVALRSTFIYLMVGYTPSPGKLKLTDGKVFFKSGKIEL